MPSERRWQQHGPDIPATRQMGTNADKPLVIAVSCVGGWIEGVPDSDPEVIINLRDDDGTVALRLSLEKATDLSTALLDAARQGRAGGP